MNPAWQTSRSAPLRWPLFALLAALLCTANPAWSHLLNMSKARVTLLPNGAIELRLALDLLVTAGSRERYHTLSEIPQPMQDPQALEVLTPLPDAIELTLGGTRLPLTLVSAKFPDASRDEFLDPLRWPRTELILSGRLGNATAAAASDMRIRYSDRFRFEEPIANTFEDTQSGVTQTRWLVTEQISPAFDASAWRGKAPTPKARGVDWDGLWDFLKAGFVHILPAGADHLLFVAALCLGASSLRALVGAVTLFTVAHSITLAAMALGWFSLPSEFIEPVIILSILWTALGNFIKRDLAIMRMLTVLVFGLIHGLGFAGAIREIGLPAEQQILSLIAFNLGVELGQVTFLLGLLTLLQGLRRVLPGDPAKPLLPLSYGWRRWGSGTIALLALLYIAL